MPNVPVGRSVCSVLAALSFGLGMLEWSPPIALGLLLMTLCIVATTMTVVASVRGTHRGARVVVSRAATVSGCLVGCWALLAFSPPVALLVVLVGALAAAPRSLRGHARRTSVGDPTVPPVAASEAQSLSSLADHALGVVWRESFWELRNQTTPEGVLRVVALRQRCLDELERRDPTALRAWLDHGGRASGGPEKYWRRPPAGSADAA